MPAPKKPAKRDADVMSSLPRSRPQRRSPKRAPSVVSEDAVPVAKPKAEAKPVAKPKAKAKPAAKPKAKPKPAARPKAAPKPLDHPIPAAMPGAPFAPPPSSTREEAEGHPPHASDQDVLSLALQAAGEVAKAGVGVARGILGRLPRP